MAVEEDMGWVRKSIQVVDHSSCRRDEFVFCDVMYVLTYLYVYRTVCVCVCVCFFLPNCTFTGLSQAVCVAHPLVLGRRNRRHYILAF